MHRVQGGLSRRGLLRASGSVAAVGGLGTLAGCTAPQVGPERMLALGDSYTVGTAVSTEDRWVNDLTTQVRERGIDLEDPRVVAEAGWTTETLQYASDGVSSDPPYDLVTLLVGANDAYQNETFADFRARFRYLVERAVAFAGGDPAEVLLLTIPDYTLTPVGQRNQPAANARRIARFNEEIRQHADSVGTRLVDLVPPSRRVAENPALVADDGLHPSPEQHDLWLERILPVAVEILEN